MSKERFTPKLHIKKGDTVQVIAGDDKGNRGIVLQVFPEQNRAIVEGLNLVKKHLKPTAQTPGEIIEKEASIHLSNLMVYNSKTKRAHRVGRTEVNGKLKRYFKNSQNPDRKDLID